MRLHQRWHACNSRNHCNQHFCLSSFLQHCIIGTLHVHPCLHFQFVSSSPSRLSVISALKSPFVLLLTGHVSVELDGLLSGSTSAVTSIPLAKTRKKGRRQKRQEKMNRKMKWWKKLEEMKVERSRIHISVYGEDPCPGCSTLWKCSDRRHSP